ncbi:hypothetical protein JJB07_02755 [Tumebacillus sp. ITR2]|uniref:Uncharacterized protein n=1 Tax=Tumebacillus amylolyticus TaxID=2801339 RepID=A0ABS1J5M9_9BACL|nr:hypothetical protein [Tumebacillus amylolyticus]MBL0385559.1 hypothetical protein [Tumebacillus amylolyticus]
MFNGWKEVLVKWEDVEEGRVHKINGVLLTSDLALGMFYGDVEIHHVGSTANSEEYDLIYTFGPLFHVGEDQDWKKILLELRDTSVLEFARKYPPLEYREFKMERDAL